jgi:ubiquinone/menaquinone biosynthesis C-methylase UbiE
MSEDFARFEHDGWQQVADKYDSTWSSLTRQFIPYLLDAVQVGPGMPILDVASGPGYVSAAARERGAIPTGIDFSSEMVAIASRLFPGIKFTEGDAQKLPFADATFDRVLMNFGLLHLSQPDKPVWKRAGSCERGAGLGSAFGRSRTKTAEVKL